MYEFAYFVWALFYAPIWIGIFAARPDFRKQMLQLGALFGVMGPISEWLWFLKDYWDPTRTVPSPLFIVEGFFYVFIITGAIAFAYPTFLKQHSVAIRWRTVVLLLAIAVAPFIVLTNVFGIVPSIGSMFIGQGLVAVYLWIRKKQFALVSLLNFIYGTILGTVIFYAFTRLYPGIVTLWWKMGTPQIMGMPVYEMVWLGFVGLGLGSIMEFMEETSR